MTTLENVTPIERNRWERRLAALLFFAFIALAALLSWAVGDDDDTPPAPPLSHQSLAP